MDIVLYGIFVIVGYLGWLVCWSDSLEDLPKPKSFFQIGSLANFLLVAVSFFVMGQTTIFAASVNANLYSEVSPPLALPVLDMNRSASILELTLRFLKLLLFEDMPRIGIYLLALYVSTKFFSPSTSVFISLVLSSFCFALIHGFDLSLTIQAAFVGAILTLVGLRHGVAMSAFLHVALNHFKIGVFFPGFAAGTNIFLGIFLNSIWVYVLWSSLFWPKLRRE